MSKRKIMLVALTICMVAILAVGGTLAYFTAEDTADNVFTIGNVNIDLKETFDKDTANLVPGVDINKDVWVENTGSLPAYVRVHLAIPFNLDDGDPAFNASKNMLHWNFKSEGFADGLWSFLPEYSTGNGYKGNGAGNWNYYTTEINGEKYAVYVVTFRSALAAGTRTPDVLDKVYLDKTVDAKANADGSITYTDTKGNTVNMTKEQLNNIHIHVYAEATQVDTFANAYDALNTVFGVPGTYNPWNK